MLELFKGIFDELTFHGTPEDRNAAKQVLMQRVDEVKELIATENLNRESK